MFTPTWWAQYRAYLQVTIVLWLLVGPGERSNPLASNTFAHQQRRKQSQLLTRVSETEIFWRCQPSAQLH